jgi:DNA (cytosine-5)-methyltransferase 1
MGYHRAGFEVVGVDIVPQPNYPFEFHQEDAFTFLADHAHEFDAIAASPECRDHTPLTSRAGFKGTAWQLADIIKLLEDTGKPYVVENVGSARFPDDYPWTLMLCADRHFGLRTVRHRKFRCAGFSAPQPPHPKGHSAPTSTKKRRHDWERGMHISITGDVGSWVGPEIMGIDWMTGNELSQAIPPAYTEYIGEYLMAAL